jgi:hypothetical protein
MATQSADPSEPRAPQLLLHLPGSALSQRWRGGLAAGLLALALLAQLGIQPVLGQALAEAVPLRCRLAEGPWRDCQLWVKQMGSSWSLVVGEERIGFRHDGKGSVLMQRSGGAWQPVQARWNKEAALCWDGVCAQGDLPLD